VSCDNKLTVIFHNFWGFRVEIGVGGSIWLKIGNVTMYLVFKLERFGSQNSSFLM